MTSDSVQPDLHFRRRHRLGHRREFAAVYEARVRKHRGALTVFAIPNSLPYHRLGLSVPRRVGSAPVRNRVKRCLRESFRLLQHELPHHAPGTGAGGGFDFVIAVRPHERQPESAYRELLRTLATQLASEWSRRDRRSETDR